MNFTEDWFTHDIPNFELCMDRLDKRELFMEIGCYEGRATCWLLQHGLADDGEIMCIDPYSAEGFDQVEARFRANTGEVKKAQQTVELIKNTSYFALSWVAGDTLGDLDVFDFIYVDGHHAPSSVLTDACMAWPFLRSGGIMLFDDYQYPHEPTKVGIDAFLAAFEGQYEIIINNYQLGVQKK